MAWMEHKEHFLSFFLELRIMILCSHLRETRFLLRFGVERIRISQQVYSPWGSLAATFAPRQKGDAVAVLTGDRPADCDRFRFSWAPQAVTNPAEETQLQPLVRAPHRPALIHTGDCG